MRIFYCICFYFFYYFFFNHKLKVIFSFKVTLKFFLTWKIVYNGRFMKKKKRKLEVKCQTCKRQNKHENKITFHIFLALSNVKKKKVCVHDSFNEKFYKICFTKISSNRCHTQEILYFHIKKHRDITMASGIKYICERPLLVTEYPDK